MTHHQAAPVPQRHPPPPRLPWAPRTPQSCPTWDLKGCPGPPSFFGPPNPPRPPQELPHMGPERLPWPCNTSLVPWDPQEPLPRAFPHGIPNPAVHVYIKSKQPKYFSNPIPRPASPPSCHRAEVGENLCQKRNHCKPKPTSKFNVTLGGSGLGRLIWKKTLFFSLLPSTKTSLIFQFPNPFPTFHFKL